MRDALARAEQKAREDLAQALKQVQLDQGVLAARQEDMNKIGELREALATTRQEKAQLEIQIGDTGD